MDIHLCDYGCGQEAKFYLKSVDKWCCSKNCHTCLGFRSKPSKTPEEIITDELCDYGCGQKAKFKFGNGKLCCSKNIMTCPIKTEKNRQSNIGKHEITEEQRQEQSKRLKGKKKSKYKKREFRPTEEQIKKGLETRRNNPNIKDSYNRISIALKNRPKSEEHKRNLSISHTGKRQSVEHIMKRIIRLSEINILKNNNIPPYPYPPWYDKELRNEIKKRDGYECMNPECKGNSNNLCVHHINYNKLYSTQINLITLCLSCNSLANTNRTKWRLFYSDIIGDIYGFHSYPKEKKLIPSNKKRKLSDYGLKEF